MNLSLFLAKRFFAAGDRKQKNRASTPAIIVATSGIAVGLAVMIVSVCVVLGFKSEISYRLTGFGSHLEVFDTNALASPESYPVVTEGEIVQKLQQLPEIAHLQRFSEKQGILKTTNDFQAVVLKGLGEDYDISFLKRCSVAGRLPKFSATKSTNEIAISRTQSDLLNLHVGDLVYAYFFENTIKMRRFKIVGIYNTNMKQFDRSFALTGKAVVNRLNDWQPDQSSGLELRVKVFSALDQATQRVGRLVNGRKDKNGASYAVMSIKENPRTASVFNWLTLLDVNIWVILVLVTLVAGFSMVSGLLILILERTSTIGLLKALGSSNTRMRNTFLYYAAFIILRGLVIGNVIGLALVLLQQHFGWVQLNPETYYVSTVPISLNWWYILLLNISTFIITLAALVVPSFIISRIQPAKAIKFD